MDQDRSEPAEVRASRSIRLGLRADEWREFEEYARRGYGDMSRFFTEKALELIASERERAGRKPS